VIFEIDIAADYLPPASLPPPLSPCSPTHPLTHPPTHPPTHPYILVLLAFFDILCPLGPWGKNRATLANTAPMPQNLPRALALLKFLPPQLPPKSQVGSHGSDDDASHFNSAGHDWCRVTRLAMRPHCPAYCIPAFLFIRIVRVVSIYRSTVLFFFNQNKRIE
jgi:hypothetical protein